MAQGLVRGDVELALRIIIPYDPYPNLLFHFPYLLISIEAYSSPLIMELPYQNSARTVEPDPFGSEQSTLHIKAALKTSKRSV
jgi:hypothetical protein